MRKLVVVLFLVTSVASCYAESSLFNRATNLLRKAMGRKDRVIDMEMPKLPKIEKDSTSTATSESYSDPNANKFSIKDKTQYDYSFVRQIYVATRHVKANENEMAQWMNVITQGGTREGVYRALVLGRDYRALESYTGVSLKKKSVTFVEHFLSIYLHKKIARSNLKTANMYSVKRLITEMALEVIDGFLLENRPQDLFIWYGILSADLAKNYPTAWKNKQRKNTNAELQMKWAKAVPIQFIKSEVIIKLHTLINYLNR